MRKDQIQPYFNEKLSSGSHAVTEETAKEIFQVFGIPVVEEIQVSTPEKAGQAAASMETPLVLKGIVPGFLHKTESDLVSLGLQNQEQVVKAAEKMSARIGNKIEAFLLQPQIQGKREFVAGMFKDPQFGPVIMFGLGGIFTEAIQDIVFKIAPLSDADMEDMFARITSRRLLGEFRGEKAVDTRALKSVLKGISDLITAHPEIKEIDINPLIITPSGIPIAVDGLIILDSAPQSSPSETRADLKALGASFYPRSIAFVGASATPGKWGHILPSNALSREYQGKIFLVNPKGGEIMGQKVYPSLDEIPGPVDLAVVTIPAKRVMDLIPALEKKEVRGMLLITSGFREVGEKGAELEQALVEKARQAGIMIMGPNTMGMCNPHVDLYCTAAHAYPIAGSTALVCQSGNMGTQLLAFAEQQGIGIRAFSGSGNEAMVTIEDYMEVFEVDDLTRIVVLYIESVKDGKRFFESAKRVSRKKPVVVLKGGRTRMGGRAAASHTGAMASDAKVFQAACGQAGLIQVEQPMELLDLSAVFSSLPLPKGNRVAIMTLGGGWGVIATDLCTEYGLEVPALTPDIVERLSNILPDYWSHGNPVDIVGETDLEKAKSCMEELLRWEGCDAVIHLGIHGQRILVKNFVASIKKVDPDFTEDQGLAFNQAMVGSEEKYIRHMVDLTEKYQKPVLGVSLLTDELSRTLYRFDNKEYKGVFFPSPERAVKALAGMCRYRGWRRSQG
nr:acetate--CoA ligase family protein [Desulfospira joergensenii]